MRSRNKKVIFIFIAVILSFLIRFFCYWFLMDKNHLNGLMAADPLGYIDEAKNIVNGGEWFMGYLNGHYQLLLMHPKGYSVLLAVLMILFKKNYLIAAHILMIGGDSIVCWFLYRIAVDHFENENAGIVSAFVWCFNPLAISNVTQDIPDAFTGFFISLILWLYYRPEKSQIKRYALLGISCGIAHYFRSEVLLIVILILLCDWIRKKSLKQVFLKWLVMAAVFIGVMSPWMIYSYVKNGKVTMSSESAWGSAWEAIGEKEDNALGIKIGDQYVWEEAYAKGYDGAWTAPANAYFKKQFISYVMENPKEYAEIVWKYRLGKAFIPGSYAWFNLNRSYDSLNIKTYCNALEGLWLVGCIKINTFVLLFDVTYSRIFSAVYFAFMILFCIWSFCHKRFRQDSFLILLWLYFPLAISMLKQIEPRNVAGNLPVLTLCTSYMITVFITGTAHHFLNKGKNS